jgi:DNA polymerase III subunit chi
MQVDFYQLTRDPAEQVLPAIAQKILDNGGRLLAVSGDTAQLDKLSAALWRWKPESFLAHGMASEDAEADAAQPILLSGEAVAANGARFIAITDGVWREEALGFDRAFYLFPPERTDDARGAWRALGDAKDVERRYWRQEGGRWVQGP